MAFIDITEEEASVIAESIEVAKRSGDLSDEYTAFHLLQTFKKEFPNIDYMFDTLDFDFCVDDND